MVIEVAINKEERKFMVIDQTSLPEGFNKADWQLYEGNKNHVRFLPKCIELFWLIFECQQLTGEAFFGQDWLASRLKISVRHVQNLIAELKSRNLIEIDRRDQNYYRVVEFFSHPLSYFTELARKKAVAAIAKLFPSMSSPNADAEKQASKPRKAATPKPAQAQQSPKLEPTVEETIAQEQETKEYVAKLFAEQEAQFEAERKACQEAPEELKQDIEAVAEEIAIENHNRPKPNAANFCEQIKARLQMYKIELPRELRGLITEIALKCLDKHRYKFR